MITTKTPSGYSFVKRIDACFNAEGAHFENDLWLNKVLSVNINFIFENLIDVRLLGQLV